MTEKRRGRPPKAKPCAECGQAVGHYDDCPVGMGVSAVKLGNFGAAPIAGTARRIEPGEAIQCHVDPFTTRQAQAYANRVWAGQSPDVKHEERIARVKRALAGQNLPFEGVVLQ